CQDIDKRLLVEIVERRQHGNAADKLRNHSELDEILGFELIEQGRARGLGFYFDLALESHSAANSQPAFNQFVQTDECATAYEEDIRRVDLGKFLVRMFTPALRGNVSDGTLEHFEECLLYSFTGNIACDRWVLVFTPDLIDFIDIDDSRLGSLDVA